VNQKRKEESIEEKGTKGKEVEKNIEEGNIEEEIMTEVDAEGEESDKKTLQVHLMKLKILHLQLHLQISEIDLL